jgi:ubiquinone/menaquinone biosynthesis C-methylase UbiE
MNEHRFNGISELYAKHRPAYPEALFDYLDADVGIRREAIMADIGSGTGIFTRHLLEHGYAVYAVEPNQDMRNTAERLLSGYTNFTSVAGLAENTSLPDKSIDIITTAQAFHWFDSKQFKTECERILKPGGLVIIIWNGRPMEEPINFDNDALNRKCCPGFRGYASGMVDTDLGRRFHEFFEGKYENRSFANDVDYDEQGFIGLNLSSSHALKENDPSYPDYILELKALFDQYEKGGFVRIPYLTQCYVGTV